MITTIVEKGYRCSDCMNCKVKIKLIPPSEEEVKRYLEINGNTYSEGKIRLLLSTMLFSKHKTGRVRCTEKMWIMTTHESESSKKHLPHLGLFYKRARSQKRKYYDCPGFVDGKPNDTRTLPDMQE